MSAAGRYLRTVMHLRPRQIWTRVARRLVRPRVKPGPAPGRRTPAGSLRTPVAREDGWISPTRVRLLNIEHEFASSIDWRPSDLPRLWTYTLNYFQDLPQRAASEDGHAGDGMDAAQAARLVDCWIDTNPPATPDTWDPYPISVRVVNWIKWVLLSEGAGGGGAAPADAGLASAEAGSPAARALNSLATQLLTLERQIEFDIGANHLMANAVALTAGGLFFGGAEGDRWARRGFALLFREVDEQVCEDGGHYERSPMYQAVVLEQLLDVLNLWNTLPDGVPEKWRGEREHLEGKALSMLDALSIVTHPDGDLSFFNDSTLGASPTLGDLRDYAGRLGLSSEDEVEGGVIWLASTDFFRLSSADGRTVALFDAGVPGPRHQPGHAHSESLSFELSRDGQRVFVNSGVSTYEAGHERLRQRQTAAHNTVRIDEEEQSEVWASHRCGRRAALDHASCSNDRPFAAHSGYHFLPGHPLHKREISVVDGSVEIVDNIHGDGEHLLEWFFHLHPDVTARLNGRTVELSSDGGVFANVSFPFGASPAIDECTWHPGFNTVVPNTLIFVALQTTLDFEFHTTIEWV